jgi:hypothetical protein
MSEVLDRSFWKAQAHNRIMRGLSALQEGAIPFGDWERLHLTAAIDDFRVGAFQTSAKWAERIMDIPRNRQPFLGRFGQAQSLLSLREEYEQLAALAHTQER